MQRRHVATAIEIGSPIVIVIIWWVVTAIILPQASATSAFFFPDPVTIAQAFVNSFLGPGLFEYVLPTLGRFLLGYGFAAVVGIVGGVLLGVHLTARMAALPFINFFRSLPGVTLIPIVTLFLGLGDSQKITLVAIASVWPILINAMDGTRSLDPTIRESARAYRITGFDRYRFVLLPSASPQIFAGLRVSLAVALIVAVVSELFGASGSGSGAGIGFFLVNAQSSFKMPQLWAGVVLLGIVGYSINGIFTALEKRVLAWHRGSRASTLE
ncbi:ABC transporter permease [Herbiconiux ginsengi]|uniref:ABC-type nitrate/sulfonate/bicarbonate transport system, permease component n=1 Tax=Herbiconiux ginsengi TaxID=381665 RepID=A0A1H3T5Y9_9MICO|nr:ABC transporter permease [Herbiconiux ginsengi]SDZ45624.1 ABC-type nitrate/sulfonate/bicarbonate transport system, permease component [Herbiconiux ginsengi]